MAADDGSVQLEILLEVKDALKRMQTFQDNASKSTKAVEDAFGSLKTVAAGALAFLTVDKIKDFFAGGIEGAVKEQDALNRLATAMGNAGDFSQEAFDHFKAFAGEMERATNFGDDLVESQLAVAESFTRSSSKAEELVKAAADLSAKTGEDLGPSVEALGKTLTGAAGALGKTIPEIRALTEEQLRHGDAIKIVTELYGGSAQAAIHSYSGELHQAQVSFENVAEAFGSIIIHNGAVITGLQQTADVFRKLESFVKDNENGINDFVTAIVRGLATSVPVAVDVLGFFIRAMEGVLTVGNLAFDGLIEVVRGFAQSFIDVIGTAIDGYLQLIDLATGSKLSAAFHKEIGEVENSLKLMSEASTSATADTIKTLEDFNKSYDGMAAVIDQAAGKVFEADAKVADSGEKTANRRKQAATSELISGKERIKLLEELQKFEEEVGKGTQNEAKRFLIEEQQKLEKLQVFIDKGVISQKDAADLRLSIEENYVDKATAYAAQHPLQLLVDKTGLQSLDLSKELRENLAIGGGILADVLGGKEGAKKLLSDGASIIGNVLAPGLGPVIGQLTGLLARGPEETKKFIKEFVDSAPQFVENVARSIPAVVDALVDSLINEGGAIKIAIALAKAFSGQALVVAIGDKIGHNFAGVAVGALTGGFLYPFAALPQKFRAEIVGGIEGILPSIGSAFDTGSLATNTQIIDGFNKGVGATREAIEKGIADFDAAIVHGVNVIHDFFTSFHWPEPEEPKWLQKFIDAVDKLSGTSFGGGGSKGGGVDVPIAPGVSVNTKGGVTVGGKKYGLHASGLDSVPSGFPNDTYFAGLTSGERVVQADANRDLTSYLKKANSSSTDSLLTQLLAVLKAPMQTPVSISIDGRKMADVILNLNRQGYRLS